jgi:hypothetical protein
VKALTWLFKESPQPLLAAGIQIGVPTAAGGDKSQLVADQSALEVQHKSPAR